MDHALLQKVKGQISIYVYMFYAALVV